MDKKWIVVIGVVGVAIIALPFFFKSPFDKLAEEMSENYIENTIERQSGGAIDVDVDSASVNIETDEGSFSSGENVKLPDDFPSDVYVYDGKLVSVIQTNDRSVMISIETDKSPADVKGVYIEKLQADGWTQTGMMDFGDSVSLLAQKGGRELSVIIGNDGAGKTSVVLSVTEGE